MTPRRWRSSPPSRGRRPPTLEPLRRFAGDRHPVSSPVGTDTPFVPFGDRHSIRSFRGQAPHSFLSGTGTRSNGDRHLFLPPLAGGVRLPHDPPNLRVSGFFSAMVTGSHCPSILVVRTVVAFPVWSILVGCQVPPPSLVRTMFLQHAVFTLCDVETFYMFPPQVFRTIV